MQLIIILEINRQIKSEHDKVALKDDRVFILTFLSERLVAITRREHLYQRSNVLTNKRWS